MSFPTQTKITQACITTEHQKLKTKNTTKYKGELK